MRYLSILALITTTTFTQAASPFLLSSGLKSKTELQSSVKASAHAESPYYYIYLDKGAPENHFIPSGWMGDYGDVRFNDYDKSNPHSGKSALKITYTGVMRQGAGWAGIYWQASSNNWGNKPGAIDLSKYKKLTFWARGEKGGEQIADFKMGGITGEYSDSDVASTGPVVLTKEWKQYTIPLKGKDLSRVVGGFCWAASRDDNPDGFVFYLDDIRYE